MSTNKSLGQQNAKANPKPAKTQARRNEHNKRRWEQHAGFSLFFDYIFDNDEQKWQTRVYHEESGKEELLSGLEPTQWVEWIFRQADLLNSFLNFAQQKITLSPSPLKLDKANLTILSVQAEEKAQSDLRNKKLAVEIHFGLAQAYAELIIAESTSYQILLLLVDQERNLTKLITSEFGLFYPDQPIHTHRLEFPIPDLGRYMLQTIVLIRADVELIAIHRGPIINIIP